MSPFEKYVSYIVPPFRDDIPKFEGFSGKKTAPVINERPKVHRNDPCPCGSKLKFKNCCLK